MGENSNIEWCHHTLNWWYGCTRVSAACDNCYAESWNQRWHGGKNWGPRAPRQATKQATRNRPRRWNQRCAELGIRERVFCSSLADVFDNHSSIDPTWRADLWRLIDETPQLDYLLLTKRPQNIERYRPPHYGKFWPDNVWLGVTAENQEEWDRRVPWLIAQKCAVKFVSMEPLLGLVDMSEHLWQLDWIITGGESGQHYRSADPNWFRAIRDQCEMEDVPFLFKQWEGVSQTEIKAKGRELDGVVHDGYPIQLGNVA